MNQNSISKNFRIIFLVMFISSQATSQNLVDTNKVWNVLGCQNFGACLTNIYWFGADTTVGSQQYKLLVVDNDSGFPSFYEPIALREDTAAKQIFFLEPGGETLIYDFSLNQGASYSSNLNGFVIDVMVDSTDTITLLNGESRKRMFVTISSQGPSYPEIWIEGIGSLMGLTQVGLFFYLTDLWPELLCFEENDTLKYHNPNYATCFIWTIGVPEINEPIRSTVSPNPFSSVATIIFSKPLPEGCTLKLLNIEGRLMLQFPVTSGPELVLERNNLAAGVYFFQVMNGPLLIATGKLLVQ